MHSQQAHRGRRRSCGRHTRPRGRRRARRARSKNHSRAEASTWTCAGFPAYEQVKKSGWTPPRRLPPKPIAKTANTARKEVRQLKTPQRVANGSDRWGSPKTARAASKPSSWRSSLEPHEFVRPLQRRKDARRWRGRSEADGGAGRQQGAMGAHVAGACMPHLFARRP